MRLLIEENSNQILDFTREIKSMPPSLIKSKLLNLFGKSFTQIIKSDIYEANLNEKTSSGLLYM